MVTSYIIHTLIYINVLSISPQPAALETFNGAISTSNLFVLLQLAFRIFRASRVTGRSIHISHPLNRVSCSCFYVLRIGSNFERAPARQWSFPSALVFFCFFFFVSIFFLPSRVSGRPLQKKELATRFEPSDVRVNTYEASINPQDHDALT